MYTKTICGIINGLVYRLKKDKMYAKHILPNVI